MRLPLKFKIVLAPAVVLVLLAVLLVFLQYTYWDLSVRRESTLRLKGAFISLVEADMAAKRFYMLASGDHDDHEFDSEHIEELNEVYAHLNAAVQSAASLVPFDPRTADELGSLIARLNPKRGGEPGSYRASVIELRSRINTLSEKVQRERELAIGTQNEDIAVIVARTTTISTLVLLAAIVIGVVTALTFARQILRRIAALSESAGRIVRGELVPPPAPDKPQDELDDLAISLNRMTDRLIRVVGTEKLLEGAEEERRRIARDIHDQTLADLSTLLRGLEQLHCHGCEKDTRQLEEDLRRAMANLREVMDDLHPQTLEILGLGPALESFLERQMGREGLPEYHLYVSPGTESLTLSRQTQLAIYRIGLEAIHNVVRHARASRYEVVLEKRGDELVLSVEDNGIGFNTASQAESGGGRGLNNIRERARAIGARVNWGASRFSSGTRFELICKATG